MNRIGPEPLQAQSGRLQDAVSHNLTKHVPIDETVGEVEALTHQIVGSTMERIRAEQRTARSRAEAQELIRLNAENRMALQSSLKAIEASSVSGLMRSSAKTKEMTAQFRALQVAKDSFQQLECAINDLRTVSRAEDVPIIRGRAAFAHPEL